MTEMLNKITVDQLVENANEALREIKYYTQEQADRMVHAVGSHVLKHSEELAKLTIEETGMGTVADHKGLVEGFSTLIWSQLKGKKSVGVIERDEEKNIIKVAHPAGIVANVTPVTAPVSGPIGNGMLALKGRNAMIVSPAPASAKTTRRTVDLMREALEAIGAPINLVQMVQTPSIEASAEVMAKSDVVIATGGPGLVKAAYSSGKPAFGVGAGNAQLILDQTDDLAEFARDTVAARLFNYATACMCTQTFLYPSAQEADVRAAMEEAGTVWVDDPATIEQIRAAVLNEHGKARGDLVGKGFEYLMKEIGLEAPEGKLILAIKPGTYGADEPFSYEIPLPIMTLQAYDSFEEALEIASGNLALIGEGHSSAIYSNDEAKILKAADELKVSRLMVNQPTSSANNGPRNAHIATMSMGCGYWGGNSSNELLDFHHLLNIQSVTSIKDPDPIPADIWDFN